MLDKLVELGRDEQNLDVTALQDARPWLRLRVRDYRVLYALAPTDVYEIERIVHRRDLDSAAAGSASSSGKARCDGSPGAHQRPTWRSSPHPPSP